MLKAINRKNKSQENLSDEQEILITAFYSYRVAFLACNSKKEAITPEISNITESVYASGIIKSKNQ